MVATKPKRGRPAIHPDRRESILDAALECFVERGFHGTSVPEIAARANIAAGTIYHYFDSKEALVNALYRSWKTKVGQRVFMAFPQGAPVRDQFRVMWNTLIEFATSAPVAFAFIETHNHTSYLDAESQAIDKNMHGFAHSMIQRAQQQGIVKPLDAWVLMELIFGAFIGLMRAHWEGRVTLTPDVIRDAEQACWDAVALHP